MRHWTLEERKKQSELIKQWKPWQSAGVKTSEGKAISKMNAYKHGARSAEMRALTKRMAEWYRQINKLMKQHRAGKNYC